MKASAILAVLATFLSGAVCLAQETAAGTRGWDIGIWMSGATGEEHINSLTEAQLWGGGIFVGRVITDDIGNQWWRGRLEYGFNLTPLFVQFGPERNYGAGFEPVVFRWNSDHHLRGTTPYVELAGGALRTTSHFPSGDTSSFNFTAKGGGGICLPIHEHSRLDIGVRWSHISNANLGVRNPEFNGIEVRVGYHWLK